jgi:hypothetical protein
VVEHTYVSRIECGRWASRPVEALRPRTYPRLRTRGGSGPALGGVSVPTLLRGPNSIWGSGTPWGSGTLRRSDALWEVRNPQWFWPSASFSGTRGVTGPFPSGERVRGRLPGEKGSVPQESGCSGLQGVVKDNYETLA